METLTQLGGLALATAVVYHGLVLREGSVANTGAIGFVIFVFTRLHAWCWEWMPKYVFFLTLGLIAVVLLLAFRWLRRRSAGRCLP
jgi:hypothetical protein